MKVPSWFLFLSAGTVRSSPALLASRPEGTAASRCCGEALSETSIQSTGKQKIISTVRQQDVHEQTLQSAFNHFNSRPSRLFFFFFFFYLVPAHVVTSVHDDWLPTVVALSNVQAGFGAKIFQLVRNTNVKANLKMWQRLQNAEENICSVHKSKKVNKQGCGLTAPNFSGFKSGR